MKTTYVPEISELTDWIKNNVLDEQNFTLGNKLSDLSVDASSYQNEPLDIQVPKKLSPEEEAQHLLEYIIGIDEMA
ncbi:hypothetical protein [Hellea balneolensis]|uniref:hypothetical protein n=1 Tax=Hellea balneolensis TaxID=287478 RepID=UPI00041BFC8A|nr:hypothetical protein [Hellea balneolensis]